jgi:hypothetical protein
MRYFRSSDAVLEQVRLALDAAWGLPANGQITALLPAADSPHDSQGRVLLAVVAGFCEYEAVAAMLPQLLASGAVEEISESEYAASLPMVEI